MCKILTNLVKRSTFIYVVNKEVEDGTLLFKNTNV